MSSTSINTNYQRPPPYICIPTAEDNTPEKGYLLIQTHTIPILFLYIYNEWKTKHSNISTIYNC